MESYPSPPTKRADPVKDPPEKRNEWKLVGNAQSAIEHLGKFTAGHGLVRREGSFTGAINNACAVGLTRQCGIVFQFLWFDGECETVDVP